MEFKILTSACWFIMFLNTVGVIPMTGMQVLSGWALVVIMMVFNHKMETDKINRVIRVHEDVLASLKKRSGE